jgi:putative ABC transport system permease protein
LRDLSLLSYRGLASNKPRSLLVVAAVVLGVAMIMAASTTNRAIDDCLTFAAEQVVGRADVEVRAFTDRGLSARSLASIASTPGVKSAVPFVRKRTYFRGQEHRGFMELIGIDPLLETEMHTYHVSEGVFLADEVNYSALLIDNWAQEHGFGRGENMEVITVDGFRSFKVVGLLSQAGLGESSFGRVIFVSLKTAQAMFGLEDRISHVSVELLPGESVETVAEELEGRIEEQFIVIPAEMIAKGLRDSLREIQGLLLLLGAVALFVGAFLIYNTWAITVSERSRDIGLLRGGGATSTQVLNLFLYEALLLATAGSAVGVVVGWGLARILARWVCITQQVVIRAVPLGLSDVLFSLAAGIGVSLLAALVPAWQGSRLTAIEALRPEYGRPAARRGRLWWALGLGTVALGAALMLLSQRALVVGAVGVVLLCIGLVPLSQPLITPLAKFASLPFHWLFGRQGDLAIRNLARTPRRTSLTVAGLTVAVAVVVALAVSVASSSTAGQRWVRSLFAGEWLIVSPVTQPMVFADELSALEGVDTILPVRNFAVNWQGRYLGAVGLPLVDSLVQGAFEIDAEERREAIAFLKQGPGVVIPRLLAQRYALSVGDEIVLRTEQGDWPFRVAAIAGHPLPAANEEGAILLPWDTMTTYFGLTGFDVLQVIPREGIDTATFEQLLASRAEQYGMETSSIEEIADTVRSAITRLFALLAAMVVAGLIVGGLGIANTMMVNVNERRREIGLLRAAGMTAEQILAMVLMEAATMGAMGGLLGTLAGLVLSTVIVEFSRSADFDPQYVIPLALLVAAFLLPMAVSVTASVYPAKSAASLSVVESLRYE